MTKYYGTDGKVFLETDDIETHGSIEWDEFTVEWRGIKFKNIKTKKQFEYLVEFIRKMSMKSSAEEEHDES